MCQQRIGYIQTNIWGLVGFKEEVIFTGIVNILIILDYKIILFRRTYMRKLIVILGLLLLPLYTHAEFSIASGVDVDHDAGKTYTEVRYFGEDWKHWSTYVGTNNTIGADVYFTVYDKVQLALGVEYANKVSDVVSTNGAYQLRIEYLITNTWSVGVKHRSNCRTLCNKYSELKWLPHGDIHTTNYGFNFLFVRYKF
jgi:hypothetical protein